MVLSRLGGKPEKEKGFHFRIPVGLHRHMKITCAATGITMEAFVRQAIEEKLARAAQEEAEEEKANSRA